VIGTPWSAYTPAEEGSLHALETDVMRFMAILAFCLLAVFALVQSVPWTAESTAEAPAESTATVEVGPRASAPVRNEEPAHAARPDPAPAAVVAAETPAPEDARPAPGTALAERIAVPAPVGSPRPQPPARPAPVRTTPASVARPAEQPAPESRNRPVAAEPLPEIIDTPEVQAQKSESATASPAVAAAEAADEAPLADAPNSEMPAPDRAEQGFTLRFETDAALYALVETGSTELYAIGDSSAWQLIAAGGTLSFRRSPRPAQIYEMTTETVPAEVVRALRRRAPLPAAAVTWGVVLPTATRRELEQVMQTASGGRLLIQDDGRLRLEGSEHERG
jgi:hypothetical protein